MAFLEISPSHNLIGTRMARQADGSLRLIPTRHDFWQRVSGAVLLSVGGGFLLGFMLYIEFYLPGPSPEKLQESLRALRAIQVLGGIIILCGVLPVLSWFRKRLTMSVDERGNLVLASRVWISRREAFPVASLQSIQYGVRRVDIGKVPVNDVRVGSDVVATVWVWSVTLVAQPRAERLDVASQSEKPRAGEPLPEEVIALCTWLRERTGKPITAAEIRDHE
jgi:hypothetical protein